MSYLIAAVLLVGILGLVNLVLSAGIIRRLREHTELLSAKLDISTVFSLAVGDRITPFTATTTDGSTLTVGSGESVVLGFFTPDCDACQERLPEFAAYAAGFPPGREHIAAVVVGDGPETAAMAAHLNPVARVVIEPEFGQAQVAVGVRGFPALCLIGPEGTIAAAGVRIGVLPVAVAV